VEYQGWNAGPAIRELRIEKNMTIENLSEAVGKSVSHITQLEEGNRKMSIDLLYALISVLGTDANTILAIPKVEKTEKLSIDAELKKLNPVMREYLSREFMHMISRAPR
jgi:hypothetical protein